MLMKFFGRALMLAIFVASTAACRAVVKGGDVLPENCAAYRNHEPPTIAARASSIAVVDSEVWLKPDACGAHARVEIERPNPARLIQYQTFNWGGEESNPSVLNIFTVCLVGHFAARDGYTHIRPGQMNDASYVPQKGVRVLVADLEKIQPGEKAPEGRLEFASTRDNCNQWLVEKYRW